MANDKHIVFLAKINVLIRQSEIERSFLWLHNFTFHTILGRNRIEMLLD